MRAVWLGIWVCPACSLHCTIQQCVRLRVKTRLEWILAVSTRHRCHASAAAWAAARRAAGFWPWLAAELCWVHTGGRAVMLADAFSLVSRHAFARAARHTQSAVAVCSSHCMPPSRRAVVQKPPQPASDGVRKRWQFFSHEAGIEEPHKCSCSRHATARAHCGALCCVLCSMPKDVLCGRWPSLAVVATAGTVHVAHKGTSRMEACTQHCSKIFAQACFHPCLGGSAAAGGF